MIKNLQEIFAAITPENIQNAPVIQDAMEIFIETLEDLSQESINIKNIFQNTAIKNELFEIYLDDLYRVLNSVSSNTPLLDSIDRVNAVYNPPGVLSSDPDYISFIKRDAITNISAYINDEQFLTFKSYKEHKGTVIAIKYIYSLLNVFTDASIAENSFEITIGDIPFEIESINGSLPAEFYEYVVRPLAHPLGFLYLYAKLITAQFEDYFPELSIVYDVDLLRVVCLQTNGTIVYVDFIDKSAEPPLVALTVTEIKNYTLESSRVQEIYLNTGEYLQQITTNLGQTSVSLFSAGDVEIIAYVGQCSIEMNYTYTVNTTVSDVYTDVQLTTLAEETYALPVETEGLEYFIGNEPQTHSELDSSELWWEIIGDYQNIGDGWIWNKIIEIATEGDSYFQLGIFDQRSADTFDFTQNQFTVDDFGLGIDSDAESIEIDSALTESYPLPVDSESIVASSVLGDTYNIPVDTQGIEIDYSLEENFGVSVDSESIEIDYSDSETYALPVETEGLEYFLGDEPQTHIELDSSEPWLGIGDTHYIGPEWIGYKTIEIATEGDSYFQLGIFDQNSDDLNFSNNAVISDLYDIPVDTESLEIDYSDSETYALPIETEGLEYFLGNEPQTHIELDSSVIWFDLIGDSYNIGDGWLYYKTIEIATDGDSYFQLGICDQRSDDGFDFSVWRGGLLLLDNNIAVI